MNDNHVALLESPSSTITPSSTKVSRRAPRERLEPAPEWLDRGQIPGLDGLRGVAILLVLLGHSARTMGFPGSPVLRGIARHGHIGVELFFVISGFLITTLLAREFERSGAVNLRRFYLRRMLRIMPAATILILTVALLQWLGYAHLELRDWIGATTYTTNFLYHPAWELGHMWSLAIEEHFYLLWPVVLCSIGLTAGWRVPPVCLAGCWIVRCGIALIVPFFVAPDSAAYYTSMAETWTFTRLDTISMGCLIALSARTLAGRTWLDRLTAGPLMGAYFLTFCGTLLVSSAKFTLCIAYTVQAATIGLLLWGLIRRASPFRTLLDHWSLRTIGLGSYSIYLWQQLFLQPHGTSWLQEFPQNTIFALLAAALSFWLIERPLNRLKDRVAA